MEFGPVDVQEPAASGARAVASGAGYLSLKVPTGASTWQKGYALTAEEAIAEALEDTRAEDEGGPSISMAVVAAHPSLSD